MTTHSRITLNQVQEIPALREPIAQRVFALLNDRQRRAWEIDEPYAVASSTGNVRHHNEDAGIIVRWRQSDARERNTDIAIVCDGMGGMQHGRFAAQLAASVFISSLLRQPRVVPLRGRAQRAVLSAQNAVYHHLRGDGGTTLTAVCIEGLNICLAHVGDSRAFEVDGDGRLTQLTRDDTIGAALNRSDPDRLDFNRLIQYIGMQTNDDDAILEPQIIVIPTNITRRGFLLTSDGAHSAGRDFLTRIATNAGTAGDLVRRLMNVADALGGLDNATALFVPDHTIVASTIGPGISLNLLAATGEAQVWFSPSYGLDDQRNALSPSAELQKAAQSPSPPPPSPPRPQPSVEPRTPKRSPSTNKRSTRRKKNDKGDDPAPLPLQVRFSEDGEDDA